MAVKFKKCGETGDVSEETESHWTVRLFCIKGEESKYITTGNKIDLFYYIVPIKTLCFKDKKCADQVIRSYETEIFPLCLLIKCTNFTVGISEL
jgi:hypothetical protein